MSLPIIAITMSAMTSPRNGRVNGRYYIERDYVDRVIAAGGAPILIPPGADVASIAPLIVSLSISCKAEPCSNIFLTNWGMITIGAILYKIIV